MIPAMPEPRFVDANGVRLALYAAGPADARPPIVLCHGWPELAYSWRWQIAGLAARGHRVLAPDQRGYGLSDRPAAIDAYTMEALTADLVGLLDAEGIERAVFVGHDWGGLVVWQLPLRYPDRVAGVVGVNTPFLRRAPVDPITLFKARFGEDFYIVFFQEPGAAEALFEADVEKTFRFFMRRGSLSPEEFAKRPAEGRSLALQKMLQRFDPADAEGQFLTEAELAVFVDAFKRTGFAGGINWYRNFTGNWERSAHLPDHVPHPALMITAELDLVLPPSLADGMEQYVPNLTRHLVKGSGHWTQQEKPDEVTEAIARWMEATFPGGAR